MKGLFSLFIVADFLKLKGEIVIVNNMRYKRSNYYGTKIGRNWIQYIWNSNENYMI